MDGNEVYYKVYYWDSENCVTVVCMQWFDEGDYHEEHFFKDNEGNVLRFGHEDEAIQWLNDNITEDKIDPRYKQGFNQKWFMKNNNTLKLRF
jgi:aconitase A